MMTVLKKKTLNFEVEYNYFWHTYFRKLTLALNNPAVFNIPYNQPSNQTVTWLGKLLIHESF